MQNTSKNKGRLTAALILIGMGLLFLLGNMGVLEIGDVFANYWPLIIVAIGVSKLVSPGNKDMGSAVFFLGLGALFLASNLDFLGGDMVDYWPVILILVGVWILFRPRSKKDANTDTDKYPKHDPDLSRFGNVSENQNPDGRIEIMAIFGGQERPIQSNNFTGGDITIIFSGSTLDLRQVEVGANELHIEVTAIFSGLDIIVPAHWHLDVSMTPLFGSVEDKRRSFSHETSAQAPRLIISGICIFTGIEITS